MIKVLNVLICLSTVIYMLVEFKLGAGSLDVEMTNEYIRKCMVNTAAGMKDMFRYALYLLGFECLALGASVARKRYLRARSRFVENACAVVDCVRLCADSVIILALLFFFGVGLVLSYANYSTKKALKIEDGDGKPRYVVLTTEKAQK